MNIRSAIFPHVPQAIPSSRHMGMVMLLVYLAWFYANLAANSIFFIAAKDVPAFAPLGSATYFLGISLVGMVTTWHLSQRWGFEIRWWPKRMGAGFWLGSLAVLAFGVAMGIGAMADEGLTPADLPGKPLGWLLIVLPLFTFPMLAYTLLWNVFFLQGFRRLLGPSRLGTAGAIVCTAAVYAVYHLASIDEIATLDAMIMEIGITFGIRVVLLLLVVGTRSIGAAFVVDWVMNWFIFLPMEQMHPPTWYLVFALLLPVAVWLAYRHGWRSSGS